MVTLILVNLETDAWKLEGAIAEVRQIPKFTMDKFSATYEGFLLDMFQWCKVRRWSFNSLFSKLSGKNDDPNDFVMNMVMPEKYQN